MTEGIQMSLNKNAFNGQVVVSQQPELCIQHQLQAQANRYPEAIAITAPGRSPLTYSRLLSVVGNVVKMLNSMGLGRNDRVAMVLPNGPEMAVAFIAVAAGATCAPLNPAYQTSEFEFYLSDLKAKAVIVQSGTDYPVMGVAQRQRIPIITLSPVLEAEAGVFTLTSQKRAEPECSGFAQSTDTALLLHTSGTTSRPKLVPLTQANICTSAYNTGAALALNSSDRCLNVMPLFHIHGLMVILASLAAGASVICTSNPDLSEFFPCMEEFRPTWYSASPTIHQAVLVQAKWNWNMITPCPLRFIRSSSSPLSPKLMAELESTYHAPVIEAYAMTEASYQISCNPLPPGKRKRGSVGMAAGPEVAIMDDMGNLLPHTDTGEIVIRGSNVTRGYENNPAANATSFTGGWLRTGDVGHLDTDGYLFITGRLKEIINKGGEKVAPREVDEVIMQHPAVAEVATFAVSHPVLGEDVAAALVLREDVFATDTEIQDFASHRLARFKVPQKIIIVDQIPKGPTGKVQRTSLAAQLGLAPRNATSATAADHVAPRTPIETKLTEIWARVLNIEHIGIHDNFFDLGGNSLLALYVNTQIAQTLGKNLHPHSLFQAPTIAHLATLLCTEEPSIPYSSLIPLQSHGSKPPFYWVHGDHSDAFLPRYLGPEQPVYGFLHQSEDGTPAHYTTVEDIAAHYLSEIRTTQPQGPYFLGGFCFGGLVAFEMAQQLQRQGQELALLVLLNTAPPVGLSSRDTRPLSLTWRSVIYRHLRNLAPLRPQEKLSYLLVRITGKLKETTRNIMNILKNPACKVYIGLSYPLPIALRSCYILNIYQQARRNYISEAYRGQLVIFKAAEESRDLRGWEKLASGGLEIHEVPGDHLNVLREPHVQVWAAQLRACLQRAQSEVNR